MLWPAEILQFHFQPVVELAEISVRPGSLNLDPCTAPSKSLNFTPKFMIGPKSPTQPPFPSSLQMLRGQVVKSGGEPALLRKIGNFLPEQV